MTPIPENLKSVYCDSFQKMKGARRDTNCVFKNKNKFLKMRFLGFSLPISFFETKFHFLKGYRIASFQLKNIQSTETKTVLRRNAYIT